MKIKMLIAYIRSVPYRIPRKPLEKCDKRIPEIVVSFTTYPKRKKCIPLVVESILAQTKRPDKIVLYLYNKQFTNKDILFLHTLEKKGVTIRMVDEDLKSHKKYFYAMIEYPESLIITIDDDIIYDKHLIEDLYNSWRNNPRAVSAKRVHKITFDNKKCVKPYNEWEHEYQKNVGIPSKELCATGCGGVLYPPHCMGERLFDRDVIYAACLHADDLWLKCMELVKNTPVVLAKSNKYSLQHIWGTVENGLAKENVVSCGNDEQLKEICKYLNQDFYELIFGEG